MGSPGGEISVSVWEKKKKKSIFFSIKQVTLISSYFLGKQMIVGLILKL